jgi:hypothetical protein
MKILYPDTSLVRQIHRTIVVQPDGERSFSIKPFVNVEHEPLEYTPKCIIQDLIQELRRMGYDNRVRDMIIHLQQLIGQPDLTFEALALDIAFRFRRE